jgi:anaerobic carbon-monoxide dehydrogenase iron sulfur subunit
MSDKNIMEKTGWGIDNLPYPKGKAHVWTRDLLCVGCSICELACAMQHYGLLNRQLSRIKIEKMMVPTSKSVQSICNQCASENRACEKACPMDPPVIHFDDDKKHMTVDIDRCLGYKCGKCKKACGTDAIHFYPPDYNYAMVCDLCEKDGVRKPQCVEVCPRHALEYMRIGGGESASRGNARGALRESQHLWRISSEEKAELLHKRLYPLSYESMGVTEELFSERAKGKEEKKVD